MKNIMVPLDFSNISENALKYACSMANHLNENIEVLHIAWEGEGKETGEKKISESNTNTLDKIKVEKLKRYIEDFRGRFPDISVGIDIKLHVETGDDVAGEIVEFCQNKPVRLIIMGTRGERGSSDTKLGSVTTEVIRNVKKAVLVIPENSTFKPVKRIVYCIDYEGYDKFTINSLEAFAGTFEAEIIVLHINTEPQYFDSEKWANFQSMVNDAYDYENLKFEFLNHESIMVGINSYLADKDVDILAMLTRNYHLISKVFPKSITRNMVLHTKIPLLAFHE